jgi:hypothetical protein
MATKRERRQAAARGRTGRPSQGGARHDEREREAAAPEEDEFLAAGERASDAGTYVNMEPADLRDRGYEALEADAGEDADIRGEAEEFSGVNANEPLDEDVELAAPAEMMIELPSGDLLEVEIATAPESEREPPSNIDEPIVRAPDSAQPETQGRAPGDEDIEANWPDEGYYDQDDTPEREG